MAELEALSNKELRQKCIEYGISNVPVTDTSRKLLIRRLNAVMSNKTVDTKPTKSNRRETMHVSKPSQLASSFKTTLDNNSIKEPTTTSSSSSTKTTTTAAAADRPSRRTIAVSERHVTTTTTVSEPEYSDVSPDRFDPEPIRIKTKTPEKPPSLYPKLPPKEPSPKPLTLSKTGVVTTSYIQETAPINKTYAAPEVGRDDTVEGYSFAAEEPIIKNVDAASKFNYVPVSEPKISISAPVGSTLGSSTHYSSLNSYNKTNPVLSTTNVRKSYIPPSTYSKPSMTSQYATAYEAEVEDDTDYDDDEDIVLVEDSPIKEIETPFLSQFARNLETLKATPLRHSVGPTKITPPKSTLRNRDNTYYRRTIGDPSSNINPRRTINHMNYDEDSPFRRFMLDLEEKYNLKSKLIIISIFILAIFIYIFFIQSV